MAGSQDPRPWENRTFFDETYFGHWTEVQYAAEGAANVVFKANLTTRRKPTEADKPSLNLLARYLLRVPKEPRKPGRSFFDAKQHYSYFRDNILNLLPAPNLFVDHRLAQVPASTITNMRQTLKALDDADALLEPLHRLRPAKFVGDNIDCPGNFVILVEDMHPRQDKREVPHGFKESTIEFKPKWLAQSPSAPKEANTCRCCALASRNYGDKSKDKDERLSPDNYPCPLWLDPDLPTPKGREAVRRRAIVRLFKNDKHAEYLYDLLKQLPTLRELKRLQLEKDPNGPLRARKEDEKFSLAMTLRDCSLFVRYREGPNGQVDKQYFEAKLADLDQKNAKWKFADWQKKEQTLVDEGWYRGRGGMKNCALQ